MALPRHLKSMFSAVIRILKRRNRIGLFQILLYATSLLTMPIDYMLLGAQKLFITKKADPKLPVIFISSYSRSGSTLVFQVLASVWNVEYINNIIVPFERSYLLSNYLFRKIVKCRPRKFESFYGLSGGMYGTNDGAQLFFKWISEEDLVRGGSISPESSRDIKEFFGIHEYYFRKPFLAKNCNIYQMFDQLAELLPNSYFIFINRDPIKIIQSTLKAREFVQGDRKQRWEFSYKDLREHGEDEDPIEEICLNLKHCLNRIEEFKGKISNDRLIIVQYEDFCRNPIDVVDNLTRKIFKIKINREKLKEHLKTFKISEGPAINKEDYDKIQSVVKTML